MMSEGDEFEEWDAEFLEQVIQVEEAISSTAKANSNPSQPHNLPPFPASSSTLYAPQPSQPPPPQQPLYSVAASTYNTISHSPPRELSQRPPDFDSLHRSPSASTKSTSSPVAPRFRRSDKDKDREIERLKMELGRASKQLAQMEKECLELKKEREKKETELKFASSRNEGENACANISKRVNMEYGIFAPEHHGNSQKFQNGVSLRDQTAMPTYKDKGVQADSSDDDLPASVELSQKLLAIWGSTSEKNLRRNVISTLLIHCQREFHILFGCMKINLPSKLTIDLLADRSSLGVPSQYFRDRFPTPEAAKVSHLCLVLTKITDETDLLETLIEPLLDLCDLENVFIIHGSLCILHTFLKHVLEMEKNSGRRYVCLILDYLFPCLQLLQCTLLRDNVFVEGCLGDDIVDSCGLEGMKDGKLLCVTGDGTSHEGYNEVQTRSSDVEMLDKKVCWSHQKSLLPHVNWVHFFETMHKIIMRNTGESVRMEAVSIMNLILLRSNAYTEREQFSQKMVFETVSQLLKKDTGLCVKKKALRLMFLLLNCPKLLVTFCSGCQEGDDSSAMANNASASDFNKFDIILQGLADCLASHKSGLQELKLCRNVILVLAFLASSGKPGFDILVGHRLSGGTNYLMLILQVMLSEMDAEAGAREEAPEIFRERTFLVREILILLDRLVSSPSYSAAVLRSLTNTRDMASLTIDVAIRLSRKGKKNMHWDSIVQHMRETEIIDLAHLFKKRVFTYLGDDLS